MMCVLVSAALLVLAPGCTALQELAALRSVNFSFANVSGVRVVGIPIGSGMSYSRLGPSDVARLAQAVVNRRMPIDLIAHVDATNPPENKVSARLVAMGWKLFVEDRQVVDGSLENPVAIAPGTTADVPLVARFDLFEIGSGEARDLFDLALGIAGSGAITKDLRLELSPTVDTSLGPLSIAHRGSAGRQHALRPG
jgi:hypothetical protein